MHFPHAQRCTVHSPAFQGPEAEECGLSACLDVHQYACGNDRVKDERRNTCAVGSWCERICIVVGRAEVKVRSEGE